MTTMPGSEYPHPHRPLMRVAVITWLLLISAAVVTDHLKLSGLAAQIEGRAPSQQVAVLEKRLTELARQVEHVQQQPAALPQARYEVDRLALELRLNVIEESLGSPPEADNLLPLLARIEQLEARLSAPVPVPQTPSRQRAVAPTKPKAVEPPFRVIGAELRAGERFLSILPATADALTQVRLLRPGEAEAGWRLENIEGSAAVFRRGDNSLRIPVPVQ